MRLGALAQFAAGGCDRAARHHHRTRAPGAGRVRRHRGVAEDDAHLGDIDAQHLVGDLGQRRLHALPMRMHADPEFEAAIRRQPRGRLFVAGHHRNAPAGIDRGPVRGLLAIDRDADADPAPVGLALALACAHAFDVDRRKRPPHRLGIIAAVEVLVGDVVERHLLRAAPDCAGALRPAPARLPPRPDRASVQAQNRRRCGPRRDKAGSDTCWWRPKTSGSDRPASNRVPAGCWRPAPPQGTPRTDRTSKRRNRRSLRSRCRAAGRRDRHRR